MACADMSEADQVGRLLLQVDNGCLVTYRKSTDIARNVPSGKVALIILASDESPAALSEMLKWLSRRWPRCPLTVVGNDGSGEQERAARAGGALYLTRPVSSQDWTAILSHALAGHYEGVVGAPAAHREPPQR